MSWLATPQLLHVYYQYSKIDVSIIEMAEDLNLRLSVLSALALHLA
jgi:hypothetical protein